MRVSAGNRLLAAVVLLIGLAGCAVGETGRPADAPSAGPSAGSATARTPSARPPVGSATARTPSGSATGSTPTAADERSTEQREAELLAALRAAGVPVSSTGDREINLADSACGMVERGADADDLARILLDRVSVISEAKARELAQIVISTYC